MKKAATWAGAVVAVLLIVLFIFWDKVQETRAFINSAQTYVYGFPLVMMDVTRDVMTGSGQSDELKAPMNQFARIRSYVTPEVADEKMISKLKALGIEPGKDFGPDKVSPTVAAGMNKAAAKVFGMLGTAQYEMKGVNGWLIPTNVGRFGTDYETHAFMAYAGLGALTSDDCLYPTTFVDSEGRLLDGGSKYTIHFEKGKLPPSDSGVWSISPYRENFYVHNPIERYGILSSMPLKYNKDGSLDIFIQAQSPGADKESNWLPSPPSLPYNLSMRVYQPSKEMMDGRTKDNLIVEPAPT